jgi:predicted nucleic acid-binding protein
MTSTLIDTNILIDVLERREPFLGWVQRAFMRLAEKGPLIINQVIYCEASVPYQSATQFDEIVGGGWMKREDVPWEAAFRAGKAFESYRRNGGAKQSALPNFFIGAHAAVKGHRILTRDAALFRTYFPEVEIIAPDTHQ